MIKSPSLLLGCTLLAATASQALALEFQDVDNKGGTLVTSALPFSGEFDITDNSTDSITIGAPWQLSTTYKDKTDAVIGAYTSTFAHADFFLKNGSATTTVSVDLDGTFFTAGTFGSSVKIVTDSTTDVSILATLDSTGKLSYDISTTSATGFTLEYALLYVTADAVPDGGSSALLMGLGMLGFAGLRRKLA